MLAKLVVCRPRSTFVLTSLWDAALVNNVRKHTATESLIFMIPDNLIDLRQQVGRSIELHCTHIVMKVSAPSYTCMCLSSSRGIEVGHEKIGLRILVIQGWKYCVWEWKNYVFWSHRGPKSKDPVLWKWDPCTCIRVINTLVAIFTFLYGRLVAHLPRMQFCTKLYPPIDGRIAWCNTMVLQNYPFLVSITPG